MMYEDVVRDFASRTRANLRAIERLRSEGIEVYETTQLVNSMLGLLVFPRDEFLAKVPETPLDELRVEGWPIPRTSHGFPQAKHLREVIRYLRNAVAHFNIRFIAGSDMEITGLRVWNSRGNRRTWQAELSLEELREIAERFTNTILDNSK